MANARSVECLLFRLLLTHALSAVPCRAVLCCAVLQAVTALVAAQPLLSKDAECK